MKIFQENCPYCGTEHVAFTILHEECRGDEDARGRWYWDTFARCGYCNRGVVAVFLTDHWEIPPSSSGETTFLEICPSPPKKDAPKHTPENVRRFFEQAMDNLSKNWDASGSMFRKALDTGLKIKFPKIIGNLNARIEKAAEQQHLTPEMAQWAHQIRLDGNDAAHEEVPFSEDDAKQLSQFARLVLLYLFTLPGMLEESQKKTGE